MYEQFKILIKNYEFAGQNENKVTINLFIHALKYSHKVLTQTFLAEKRYLYETIVMTFHWLPHNVAVKASKHYDK